VSKKSTDLGHLPFLEVNPSLNSSLENHCPFKYYRDGWRSSERNSALQSTNTISDQEFFQNLALRAKKDGDQLAAMIKLFGNLREREENRASFTG